MTLSRYRFALRPKWIASHVFVGLLCVGMIAAMFWQIDRLHQKKDRNARIRERRAEQVVPVERLAQPGDPFSATAGIEFRRVTATGRYLADEEVLVRSRSRNSSPGSWILTPLDLGDGVAVTVNRGWIPNSGGIDRVPARYRAPSGKVTVSGFVRQTETRGSFGPRDPKTGTLDNLARADIARLDRQVPERLLPLYVQLEDQSIPIEPADPRPVPSPELDEGPHFSYAVQWAIFTLTALVGYPLILRRRAREIEQEEADEEYDRLHPPVDPDQPDPHDEPVPGDPRLDPVDDR